MEISSDVSYISLETGESYLICPSLEIIKFLSSEIFKLKSLDVCNVRDSCVRIIAAVGSFFSPGLTYHLVFEIT